MGIYSSVVMTREEAEKAIKEAVEKLDCFSNEELADILFGLYSGKVSYNYRVTSRIDEADCEADDITHYIRDNDNDFF